MKRGTPDHPKTQRLARALGLKRWEVVGLLESLWHFTAQYAKRGDIGRWPNAEIAAAIGWDRGDPDALIGTLVECRFFDRCEAHRLLVHDWCDHADQTVGRSAEVQKLGFASNALAVASETHEDESTTEKQAALNGFDADLPKPKPKPEPVPEPKPKPTVGADSDSLASALVCSDSDSGQDARTAALAARAKGRVEYHLAMVGLFGKALKQRRADLTVSDVWWDEWVWPEALEHNRARERLATMLGLIRQAAERDRPMAWLTRRVATWRKTGK